MFDVVDVINVIRRCNHIVSIIDVIEKLYKCTCLYVIRNTISVYNMLMQFLTYNTSGKAVITTASRNQH